MWEAVNYKINSSFSSSGKLSISLVFSQIKPLILRQDVAISVAALRLSLRLCVSLIIVIRYREARSSPAASTNVLATRVTSLYEEGIMYSGRGLMVKPGTCGSPSV